MSTEGNAWCTCAGPVGQLQYELPPGSGTLHTEACAIRQLIRMVDKIRMLFEMGTQK